MRQILISAAALALFAGAAQAQTTIVTTQEPTQEKQAAGTLAGAGTGAVAGALVGGPVGAAIGGVAGTVIGAGASAPDEVRSYVVANPVDPVIVQGDIVDGYAVPETVTLVPVPDNNEYGYFYANDNRPVIVSRSDRRVVYVVRD